MISKGTLSVALEFATRQPIFLEKSINTKHYHIKRIIFVFIIFYISINDPMLLPARRE